MFGKKKVFKVTDMTRDRAVGPAPEGLTSEGELVRELLRCADTMLHTGGDHKTLKELVLGLAPQEMRGRWQGTNDKIMDDMAASPMRGHSGMASATVMCREQREVTVLAARVAANMIISLVAGHMTTRKDD